MGVPTTLVEYLAFPISMCQTLSKTNIDFVEACMYFAVGASVENNATSFYNLCGWTNSGGFIMNKGSILVGERGDYQLCKG